METGTRLTAPQSVQRLQTTLHAKAKEAPGFRFYSLCDKVWRADVLAVAWQEVRGNRGAAGVDGETVADVEVVWSGPVAWSPGAGPEGGDLPAAGGTAGPDPEEATREVTGPWAFPALGTG